MNNSNGQSIPHASIRAMNEPQKEAASLAELIAALHTTTGWAYTVQAAFELERARATIERLCAWRSIEIAPRDGTQILTCRNALISPLAVAHWNGRSWAISCGPTLLNVTHWMPLPDLPQPSHEQMETNRDCAEALPAPPVEEKCPRCEALIGSPHCEDCPDSIW